MVDGEGIRGFTGRGVIAEAVQEYRSSLVRSIAAPNLAMCPPTENNVSLIIARVDCREASLKILTLVIGGIVGLVVLVLVVGLLLPEGHRASSYVDLAAPRVEVWAAIVDFAGYPEWRPDVERVEARVDSSGDTVWVEHGAGGALPLQIAERTEPSRLVVRIVDDGLPFGGRWTYELEELSNGTRVTITEDGKVYNPIFRVISTLFLSEHATMDRYLVALAAKFSEEAYPVHAP